MEVWFLRRWKEMGYRAQREELASTGRDIYTSSTAGKRNESGVCTDRVKCVGVIVRN